jgi:hypothetical protein
MKKTRSKNSCEKYYRLKVPKCEIFGLMDSSVSDPDSAFRLNTNPDPDPEY